MRTFIAIDLDHKIRERIASLQAKLKSRGPKLSWVRPEAMHLTIKFLGEVEEAQIEPIKTALAGVAAQGRAFDITFGGLGVFPPHGRANVLWLGIEDKSGGLKTCWKACEDALAGVGLPREDRPFSAHLTLARNKNPRLSQEVRKLLQNPLPFEPQEQRVHGLTFYQSTLTAEGSIHEVLSRHEFSAA
ncbi:MAG TPA: RNA 2',3'-cyclic phosphodiesterase [Phycisphaerae bacterium]|nr:RNA 2',3'-cyclic phosphodiesterase [Phycisphaerae bacterium]